jgi:hypothetical protein
MKWVDSRKLQVVSMTTHGQASNTILRATRRRKRNFYLKQLSFARAKSFTEID